MLKPGDIISGDNANYKVVEYEMKDMSSASSAYFEALLILEIQRTDDLMFNLHHLWLPAEAKYIVIDCTPLGYDYDACYTDSKGSALRRESKVFPDIFKIVRSIREEASNLIRAKSTKRKH